MHPLTKGLILYSLYGKLTSIDNICDILVRLRCLHVYKRGKVQAHQEIPCRTHLFHDKLG